MSALNQSVYQQLKNDHKIQQAHAQKIYEQRGFVPTPSDVYKNIKYDYDQEQLIIDICCGTGSTFFSNYNPNPKYLGFEILTGLNEIVEDLIEKYQLNNIKLHQMNIFSVTAIEKINRIIQQETNGSKMPIHIVFNPPYQSPPTEQRARNVKLWPAFIKKTLEIAKLTNIASITVIHPDWVGVKFQELLNKILDDHFVESIQFLNGNVFKVGVDISITKIIPNKKYNDTDETLYFEEDENGNLLWQEKRNALLNHRQRTLDMTQGLQLAAKIVNKLSLKYNSLSLNEGDWLKTAALTNLHGSKWKNIVVKKLKTSNSNEIVYYDSGNIKRYIDPNHLNSNKGLNIDKLVFGFSAGHNKSGRVFQTTDIVGTFNHWIQISNPNMLQVYEYVYSHELFKFLFDNYNKSSGFNAYVKNKKLPLFKSIDEVNDYVNDIYSQLTAQEIALIK